MKTSNDHGDVLMAFQVRSIKHDQRTDGSVRKSIEGILCQ
jgi:hypothetical protein